MPNPVTWFEVHSKDSKSTQAFFKKLFGWKIDANNPMKYGLVDTGTKKGITGGFAEAMKGAPNMVTIYVEVDDLDAYVKKAVKLGSKVVVPVTTIPDMATFAMILTPDKIAIGLFGVAVSDQAYLILMMVVAGVGLGLMAPAGNIAILEVARADPAVVTGIRGMLGNLGAVMGAAFVTVMLSFFSDKRLGFQCIFAVFIFVCLAVSVVVWLIPDIVRKRYKETQKERPLK